MDDRAMTDTTHVGGTGSPPDRAAPPPRDVPVRLRLYILLLYSQPAAFVLGLGLSAFCAFGLHSDWKSFLFRLPTANASGSVTGLRHANGSLGGGRNPSGGQGRGSIAIAAVTYTFTAPGGGSYRGVSYFTTDTPYLLETDEALNVDHPQGATVPVQYVAGYPTLSRIRGMRTGVFEAYALLTAVFPLFGLAALRFGRKSARWTCALLAEGTQDAATGNLRPPAGHARATDPPGGYEISSFMAGSPCIRDGQFQPPGLARLLLVCLLPGAMLVLTIITLRQPG